MDGGSFTVATYRELRSEVIDIKFNEENFWKYIDSRMGTISRDLHEYLKVDQGLSTASGDHLVQVFEASRTALGVEFLVHLLFEFDGDVRHITGNYLLVAVGDDLMVHDFERKFCVTLRKRESGIQFWSPAFDEICSDMLSRLKSISPKI